MSNKENRTLDRRNILLGGTTLAAVSALGSGAPVRTAQAQGKQQPAPAAGGKRRTSSSSSATTSARPTSAPTRSA